MDVDDDWLGSKSDPTSRTPKGETQSKSPERTSSQKQDDWLGLGKEDDADDWLSATLKSKREKKSAVAADDDWLGLGPKSNQFATTKDSEGGKEKMRCGFTVIFAAVMHLHTFIELRVGLTLVGFEYYLRDITPNVTESALCLFSASRCQLLPRPMNEA